MDTLDKKNVFFVLDSPCRLVVYVVTVSGYLAKTAAANLTFFTTHLKLVVLSIYSSILEDS